MSLKHYLTVENLPCFPFHYPVLFFFFSTCSNPSFHKLSPLPSSSSYLSFLPKTFDARPSLQHLHDHFKWKALKGPSVGAVCEGKLGEQPGCTPRRRWTRLRQLSRHEEREELVMGCPVTRQLVCFHSSPFQGSLYFLSVLKDPLSLSNTAFPPAPPLLLFCFSSWKLHVNQTAVDWMFMFPQIEGIWRCSFKRQIDHEWD